MACGARDGTPVHLEAAPIPHATINAIKILIFSSSNTTFRSESLFYPQYELVPPRPILNAKLVIAVRIKVPFTRVPDHARTYCRYLLGRVQKRGHH